MEPMCVGPETPRVVGRTGRGVRIAVLDSGVNPWHPHVRGVEGGVDVLRDGSLGDDWTDRLGHGTAVTAAIKHHAPDAELWAVRIFGDRLATTLDGLVAGLEWSIARGAHLVNLSLGTTAQAHRPALEAALARARSAGVLVVSAAEHEGVCWLPGGLPDALGVRVATDLPPLTVRFTSTSAGGIRAESVGLPRSIPGVPAALNVHGISFAVANATGALARLLEAGTGPSGMAGVARALEALSPSASRPPATRPPGP
ncbi:MAG: S8 family serine peptidase [Gemmatimonadota bacterium]